MPRRKPIILPSADYLHACFNYNPINGELQWKHRPRSHYTSDHRWRAHNKRRAGTPAGCIGKQGYSVVAVNDILYRTHRIIWKLVTGEEPPEFIDHKDRDRANNRWTNLRAATMSEQSRNRLRSRTKAPARGVFPVWKGKYRARIGKHNLGTFNSPEAAAAAYEAAARILYKEFDPM